MARRRDRVLAGLLALGWLLPVAYVGTAGKTLPGLPAWVGEAFSIACLFPRPLTEESAYYVEVRCRHEASWRLVADEALSTLRPFGYRNRIGSILNDSRVFPESGDRQRRELAAWIATRDLDLPCGAEGGGGHASLEVRFLRHPVAVTPESRPRGRWRAPDLLALPPDRVQELSRHVVPRTY